MPPQRRIDLVLDSVKRLAIGNVPLTILEQQVDGYIRSRKN
jgi:hypothetical protein